jgi:hypothetical protein
LGKTTDKKKAPSRVRYEQGHPTVSCRVPKDVHDRLRAAKEREGKSFADLLKIGLGVLEVQAEKEVDLVKNGYMAGYHRGYADAESAFGVTYSCSTCGNAITVRSREEKEAIRNYMEQEGWGHRECHERER